MAHLGSLGKKYEPSEALTFDYFGETFTVADNLTDLEYLDFIEEAATEDVNSDKGRTFLKEFARLCLGDDFERFWKTAKSNRQTMADVFTSLSEIMEAATARPTESPSDSSDGQQSTAPRSEGVSPSVLAQLDGRPDLQLVVVKAAEARAAS